MNVMITDKDVEVVYEQQFILQNICTNFNNTLAS